jgi:hypothetical protein
VLFIRTLNATCTVFFSTAWSDCWLDLFSSFYGWAGDRLPARADLLPFLLRAESKRQGQSGAHLSHLLSIHDRMFSVFAPCLFFSDCLPPCSPLGPAASSTSLAVGPRPLHRRAHLLLLTTRMAALAPIGATSGDRREGCQHPPLRQVRPPSSSHPLVLLCHRVLRYVTAEPSPCGDSSTGKCPRRVGL